MFQSVWQFQFLERIKKTWLLGCLYLEIYLDNFQFYNLCIGVLLVPSSVIIRNQYIPSGILCKSRL